MDFGYIYILKNEMYNYYGDDVFKIGRTQNISIRMKSYKTCYIEPCEIKYISPRVNHQVLAEYKVFTKLNKYRIKQNREFFKIENLKEITDIIDEVVNEINNTDRKLYNKELELAKEERKIISMI